MRIPAASYVLLIVAGLVGGLSFAQREGGIFSCQAKGYSANHYLAYCAGDHYGDYDHGAFWLDLEPVAQHNAASADALFLGNSRLQVALASHAADDWFRRRSSKYYLMGFMYNEPMLFARDVLAKLRPRARLYVINVDSFFRNELSEPAQFVEADRQALSRYREKRDWQRVHSAICGTLPQICGRGEVWYRARDTGALSLEDAKDSRQPPTDVTTADADDVAREIAAAEPFLADLGVPRSCVIFTLVPRPRAPVGTARAIAAALNVTFIAPEIDGLMTRDASHLDASSVDRWSEEFFRQASPEFDACLGNGTSQ